MIGQKIKMPNNLSDGLVDYADGTEATVDQMAKDVTTFLSWAAEPELESRHKTGVKVILYLILLVTHEAFLHSLSLDFQRARLPGL